MKTIWKFPLIVNDFQQISIPAGAQLLDVQVQHDQPCLWALVDPAAPREFLTFRTVGTGHPFIDDAWGSYRHIGTYQLAAGGFVGHVFVETRG